MKGLNVFLWIGTPALFLLVGALVWTAHKVNDQPYHHSSVQQAPVILEDRVCRLSTLEFCTPAEKAAQLVLDDYRRALAPNQRCYGGYVIQQNGSTYTQLGTAGDLVRCVDRMADRPVR